MSILTNQFSYRSWDQPRSRVICRSLIGSFAVLVTDAVAWRPSELQLDDGRILQVDSVVWATGFRPDYQWIDLPIFDEIGFPGIGVE